MIEAFIYGMIASLTFIGFVSLVYFIVLHIYRPKENGRFVLFIPNNATNEEISSLIYGAHLRNLIYGSLISEDVFIFDNSFDESVKETIIDIAKNYGGIQFVNADNILSVFHREEENGTGIC